jgi:uncharacterized membrane protein YdjX (TVP38/TMEM64 family)
LRQRELCDRIGLDYKTVALLAKHQNQPTHAFLQQETGWILHEELYYPPGTTFKNLDLKTVAEASVDVSEAPKSSRRQKRWIRILELLLIAIVMAGAIALINHIGMEQLRENIDSFGWWAPLLVVALRLTSIVIPALPGTAYSLLAGAVFGFWEGLLVIAIADLIACTFNFYIAKRFGRDLVQRLVGQRFMNKVDTLGQQYLERNFFLVTGLLMTGLFDFVCYGVGLTKMRWTSFLAALLVSVAIAKPPLVALGAGALEGGRMLLGVALLGMFALAMVTGWVNQQKMQLGKVNER